MCLSCLSVVALLAEALQVVEVEEDALAAFVINNVIGDGGWVVAADLEWVGADRMFAKARRL